MHCSGLRGGCGCAVGARGGGSGRSGWSVSILGLVWFVLEVGGGVLWGKLNY